jgi:cytochrome P450
MVGPSSLLVVDGPEHMRQRRLLLAPFHGDRIARFQENIHEVTRHELASWRPGVRLSLRERMRRITFHVMCQAVIGIDDASRIEALRASVGKLIDSHPLYLLARIARADLGPLSPGRRYRKRVRAADELLLAEIARRRRRGATARGDDVLSLALVSRDDEGRPLTDGELRDVVFTLLAAGYETTATSLAFALELLIHNRASLDRLREELAGNDDDRYLYAVVKEALRLRPPFDNVQRKLARSRQVGGYTLPAGVTLYPGIIAVHLDAELYPDPHAFRPERFLEAAGPYGWIPFGGGIRRCVGAALAQVELAEVLRAAIPAVELRAVRGRPDPVVLRGITLAPKHGVEVEVLRSRSPARRQARAAS